MSTEPNTVDALKAFRTHLDVEQLAEDLGCTPAAAEKIWAKARRELARKKFSRKASREFAAELDEMFDVVQAEVVRQLLGYAGGSDKLNGYASVGKLLADMAKTRYAMRQDLGLIPGGRILYPPRPEHSRNLPPPVPVVEEPEQVVPAPVVVEPTLDQLERELAALQSLIAAKRVSPPASPAPPPPPPVAPGGRR